MDICKNYENDDIIVYWKPKMCAHAGKCVKGAPGIFDVKRKPWIKLDGADIDNLTKVIDSCPSGALSYELKKVR